MAPADCDGARFSRDLCGFKLLTMSSTSMEPTLGEKDLVAEAPYADSTPARGDIIAFEAQSHRSSTPQLLLMRLIGLPGDRVELRKGVVLVNDVAFVTDLTDSTLTDLFGNTLQIWDEVTPEGRAYDVAKRTGVAVGPAENAGPFVVPEGHYFVLGDNRDNAADSRYPDLLGENGFIPAKGVLGHIVVILASKNTETMGMVMP